MTIQKGELVIVLQDSGEMPGFDRVKERISGATESEQSYRVY